MNISAVVLDRKLGERLRGVKNMLVPDVARDPAVPKCDGACAVVHDLRVMGHEYDRSTLGMEFLEQNQNLKTGACV